MLAEITSEGPSEPLFMLRRGRYKYVSGGGDPPLLFDLEADPDERDNLAGKPALAQTQTELAGAVEATWDVDALRSRVLLSQRRRRLVQAAHGRGRAPTWDHAGEDPLLRSCYRGAGSYDDWAFQGIG